MAKFSRTFLVRLWYFNLEKRFFKTKFAKEALTT